MCGLGEVHIVNEIKQGLPERVTFEQRPKDQLREPALQIFGRKIFQRTDHVKSPQWEGAWHVWGAALRPFGLQWSE